MLGLDHVVLRVADLDTALGFYCGLLGCAEERRIDEIGLIQVRAGAALIDLVPVDSPLGRKGGAAPGREGHNLDHFCLRVGDFDGEALRAELLVAGFSPSEVVRVYGAEGYGPSIYVDDPDGNTVELKGPAEA
jgi:catechol 2,3-dioxygenase-like lactoylglutathione lyase family enzyme